MEDSKSDWDYPCAKLQKAYDLATSASDDFSFYINLINYVSLFDQITILKEFVESHIMKVAKQDNKELNRYEEKIIKEVLSITKKVKTYLKTSRIDNSAIENHLKEASSLYEEKIFASNGKMKSMYGSLNIALYLLWDLDEAKHKKFVKQFGKIDKDGNIRWKMADLHDDYDTEELRLKRIGLIKIWYHWDKIAQFYNIFIDYEKMSKDWFEKKSFMTLMGLGETYKEIKQIFHLDERRGKEEKLYFFQKDDLCRALKQFHYHFLDAIDLIERQRAGKTIAKFNNKSKELTIKGQIIPFKGSKRSDLLELLFEKKKRIYFPDVLEFIEGVKISDCTKVQEKKYKKNFSNYCSGVKDMVAKRGITDFLITDANFVEINPLYIKSS